MLRLSLLLHILLCFPRRETFRLLSSQSFCRCRFTFSFVFPWSSAFRLPSQRRGLAIPLGFFLLTTRQSNPPRGLLLGRVRTTRPGASSVAKRAQLTGRITLV